jgi:hypothetical protein
LCWQWIAALALGLAGQLVPASARALELSWSAPAECSDAVAQRTHIEQLLARQGLSAVALVVTGTVTREQAHYRLALRITTSSHEAVRAVQLADCAAVDQATIALIGMAVDPGLSGVVPGMGPSARDRESNRPVAPHKSGGAAATGASRPMTKRVAPPAPGPVRAPAPELERPPADAVPPAAEQEEPEAPAAVVPLAERAARDRELRQPVKERAERAETTRVEQARQRAARELSSGGQAGDVAASSRSPEVARRWGRVATLIGVWNGGLPRSQVDTGARVGLARGLLYGELSADWMLPRRDRLDRDAEAQVRFHSFSVGVAGCAAFGLWADRVRLGPCARLSVLRTFGSITQITAPRDDRLVWLASTASALFAVRLFSLLELSLEAGAGLPLSRRPRFYVAGRGSVETARLLALQATLGLGVRWQQKSAAPSRNASSSPIGR